MAFDFDQRPGLKFLLQKIFNSTVAANLYKQTVTAWTIRVLCLFELFRRNPALTPTRVKCLAETKDPWMDPLMMVETQGEKGIGLLADSYARVCRELSHVEQKTETTTGQEPFVFLLASSDEQEKETKSQEEEDTLPSLEDDDTEEKQKQKEDEEVVYKVVDEGELSTVLAGKGYSSLLYVLYVLYVLYHWRI